MAYSPNAPVFAGRYRFQTVGNDWDRGRSGFTHLVFDIKKERLGVIKRAEIGSQQAVEGLKNEIAALLDLKGQGVPEVYDTGDAEYGSKDYFYVVIEYIEGIRVEKNLDSLTPFDRAEILNQFFGVLAKSHKMGIVNGDVDLKHLFWHTNKKQLFVIDWGNAKHDVDLRNKTEFAYDLARSAEIIYSLTTRKGHPVATGSIELPNESAMIPGLTPLPVEFRNLCKWAPRTPVDGAQSPYTAQELWNASKNWLKIVQGVKPNWGLRLLLGIIVIVAIYLGIAPNSPMRSFIYSNTPTHTIVVSTNTPLPTPIPDTVSPIETPSATEANIDVPALTPTVTLSPTFTIPTIIPDPRSYVDLDPALVFKENLSITTCWAKDTNLPNGIADLKSQEGFYIRNDKNWGFKTAKERTTDQFILTDFDSCLNGKPVSAIALNAWVSQLGLQIPLPDSLGKNNPETEFGVFVEYANDYRREYTIWVDKEGKMYLRVRDGKNIVDNEVLIVNTNNLKLESTEAYYPFFYSTFPIQFFLEINNNNLDIIYLKDGSRQGPVKTKELDPIEMTRIDWAVLPTLGPIERVGLIGHGGNIQTVIWPLIFFGE